ncbi:MAG: hypothetical protein ACNA8H_14735, partial [Anaerolineales bacterium]
MKRQIIFQLLLITTFFVLTACQTNDAPLPTEAVPPDNGDPVGPVDSDPVDSVPVYVDDLWQQSPHADTYVVDVAGNNS